MAHQSELIATDIHAYLTQHQNKELLRFLTCGSVDDGKSTLIGRLLHDSKMIYEDQLAAIARDSQKSGSSGDKIDLALLVDGLQAEREQGITIDVAYRYFSTSKRKFIIADTPGHEQYTRNMATGASTCDLAIILIDARHGVMTQTRRHSFIASLLGIKHLVVAINKMDLVGYAEDRFAEIKTDYLDFARHLPEHNIQVVPLSALNGDNVVSQSKQMPWYAGEPLMSLLENIDIQADDSPQPFRLPVQYVSRPDLNFRGFAGTIASGQVKPGDTLHALPSGQTARVERIVTYAGDLPEAQVGQAVTLTLSNEIDISRGDVLVKTEQTPLLGKAFTATLIWMHADKLIPGQQYDFKVGHQRVTGTVSRINEQIDVNTLARSAADVLALNAIATVTLQLTKTIVVDSYQDNRRTGAFVMIDRISNSTVAAGMIIAASDVTDEQPLSAEDRALRYRQQASTLLLTMASADQLAVELERRLFALGHAAVVVTAEDAALVCPYVTKAGLIAIVSGDAAVTGGIRFAEGNIEQLLVELRAAGILAGR